MVNAICRFFNEMLDCKLEDFAVATFLDPRYKYLDFKNVGKWMRGTLTKEVILKWAEKAYTSDWKTSPKSAPDPCCAVIAPRKEVNKLASFLDSDDEEEGSVTVEEVVKEVEIDEFKLYVSMPSAPLALNPLEWWKGNAGKLPNLARMARQFLGAPASTGGVERAFNNCGQMHSDLRKNTSEGTLQHAMMPSMNTV